MRDVKGMSEMFEREVRVGKLLLDISFDVIEDGFVGVGLCEGEIGCEEVG